MDRFPVEETSEDGWHASVEGNLTATFLCIKSVLPGMKQRKTGCILTILPRLAVAPIRGRPCAALVTRFPQLRASVIVVIGIG